MKYTCTYSTKTGIKNIHIITRETSVDIINGHSNYEYCANLCRNGCVNYDKKWCCPPHAKPFYNLSKPFNSAIIICMHLHAEEFRQVQNKYLRVRAANMVLKKLSNCLARDVEQKVNGYALLNGSCNLCRPCNLKKALPCKKPQQMRYSMEATGINVTSLLKDTMEFDLQWYSPETMPLYTSVVSSVLFNYASDFGGSPSSSQHLDELLLSSMNGVFRTAE